METLIEVSDYSFKYRKAKDIALQHINFNVYKGEVLAIIGPTGAGKTTLCRSIVGLIPSLFPGKSAGSVKVLGRPVTDYSVEKLASIIGYVHQDAESQILMTNVEKEIVFPLENLGLPREVIKERLEQALALVHLENYRTRHPFYLSGGQRQRVVLATALAMNPEVLILDEAVSEIDPIGAEEIMTVAKELNNLGKTIVIIEHNMEEIARFADRIIVLSEGEQLAEGKTRDILTDKDLLGQMGMYMPEAAHLFMELKKRGVDVGEIPIVIEEAKEQLQRLCARKGS